MGGFSFKKKSNAFFLVVGENKSMISYLSKGGMKMKKAFRLLIPLSLVCLISCGSNKPAPSFSSSFPSSESSISSSDSSSSEEKEDVTIIYTNDIHGYIANSVKDPSGAEAEGLRLSHISGYVDHLRNSGKNVLVVDAGDEVQGSVYGALDRGKDMIKIIM